MKYYRPRDFLKMIRLLDPNKFLKDIKALGELDEITGNYALDCTLLCENSVAWSLKQLYGTVFYYSLKVCYGRYSFMSGHYWLRLGDYNIDLTLKQVVRDAPALAITKIKEVIEYEAFSEKSAERYIEELRGE